MEFEGNKPNKIRMSNKKCQSLVTGHKLHTCGAENLLPTGAKIRALGGGWWQLTSYHWAGKDIAPYLN